MYDKCIMSIVDNLTCVCSEDWDCEAYSNVEIYCVMALQLSDSTSYAKAMCILRGSRSQATALCIPHSLRLPHEPFGHCLKLKFDTSIGQGHNEYRFQSIPHLP